MAGVRNSGRLRHDSNGVRLEAVGIADDMRAKGMRMTVQRRLVLDVLRRARHHTTAEDISRSIRASHPQIDPSTVYRNLEALERLGYVTHTHLDDRVTRWRRSDSPQHGHLVCRKCGSEEDIPMQILEPPPKRLPAGTGFPADSA